MCFLRNLVAQSHCLTQRITLLREYSCSALWILPLSIYFSIFGIPSMFLTLTGDRINGAGTLTDTQIARQHDQTAVVVL